MTQPSSAVILPFPVAVRAAAAQAEHPTDRLRRALERLDTALAVQRQAVVDWRAAMAELNGRVQGLGQSLSTYQQALEGLQGRLPG